MNCLHRVRKFVACGCLALSALAGSALAHKGSDAYLDVQEADAPVSSTSVATPSARKLHFTLAVAIKDLDLLLPMDANADGKVTWGEARAAMPAVLALANEAANLEAPRAGGTVAGQPGCHLQWQLDGMDRRGDGAYVRLKADASCPASESIALRYTLLRDQDANHRLLVAGHVGGKDLLTTTSPQQPGGLVFAPVTDGPATAAKSPAAAGATVSIRGLSALRDYFELGVQHLLRGYDHLAFLLALVMPLRLVLFGTVPAPAGTSASNERSRAVWWTLLRTITAFTIGHSITLILATVGWTQVSPRWVEPAIALTILFTAMLNLRPVHWVRMDVLALLFGMVHGIGFAGLLQEAAAPSGLLPWALAGFNLGVEAGQLIAVTAWVLLSQPVVGKPWYPAVVVRGGSVLLMLLAGWWFWQRVS